MCVLESDFGFSVNCNFKKSGLFRVRNLGGLKAHFGLGNFPRLVQLQTDVCSDKKSSLVVQNRKTLIPLLNCASFVNSINSMRCR
jgi:hypothetical protein